MKDIKKSRPGDCSTRTAEGTAAYGRAAVPRINSITDGAGRQIQISGYLLAGAKNAIPRRHLQQLIGLSDRELRRRIQEERLAGVPILSSNAAGGYYLPADNLERARFVRSMRGRAQEIQAVAAAVEGPGEMSEISPPSEG